ncbi:hypothetical protein [Crocosphaera sp.]|nr:hypothetical protein [Crocosphaera sp.]
MNKNLPFSIKTTNEITEETFKKTDKEEELINCKNTEDIFNNLGI